MDYTTLKHGDRVTCEIGPDKILDAKISINKNKRVYICQNERNGGAANDKLGYKYSWGIGKLKDFYDGGLDVTNLKLASKDKCIDYEIY